MNSEFFQSEQFKAIAWAFALLLLLGAWKFGTEGLME